MKDGPKDAMLELMDAIDEILGHADRILKNRGSGGRNSNEDCCTDLRDCKDVLDYITKTIRERYTRNEVMRSYVEEEKWDAFTRASIIMRI